VTQYGRWQMRKTTPMHLTIGQEVIDWLRSDGAKNGLSVSAQARVVLRDAMRLDSSRTVRESRPTWGSPSSTAGADAPAVGPGGKACKRGDAGAGRKATGS
jgi:hypothetical protein